MKKLLYILMVVVLASCGTETSQVTDILGSATGHFRGNSIGDKYKKVETQVAGDNVTLKNEGIIQCEFAVDQTEVLAIYEFDQGQLYSVQADLFFPDSTTRTNFQSDLVSHYNQKYGQVNEDGGFLVWQEAGKVELTLADESMEFGQPKLSITIYNFDY